MSSIALPEHVVARFRAVSFERLERIEATWLALTHGGGEGAREDAMYRDLHTLKGDARVVGFSDVAVLAQRLEDLLAAARVRRYRVHEDVDIVVQMGLQFIGMLLRRKHGAPRAGIDLDGFLKQLEDVLGEWLRRSSEAPALGAPGPMHLRLVDGGERASASTRHRLSVVATSVYLESLRVGSGASRSRLRDIWRVLGREVALLDATPLAPIVERHAAAATELARDLGREVTIVRDVKDAAIAVGVIDAVHTAILHALRNAVDHGVEPAAARQVAGKPAAATIAVRAARDARSLAITVEDDGAGVDLARVRERAGAAGILGPDARPTDADLLEILFVPGFSTRETVTDVSGRGVGLDAVRAAVAHVGGTAEITSVAGQGTTLTIRIPQASKTLDVHAFRGARTSVIFAVPASWAAAVSEEGSVASVDVAETLALPPSGAPLPPRAVLLKRDRMSISLAASGAPERTTATRLCPTPDEEPIEVVELARGEAILGRPDRILAERRARAGGP